MSTDWDAIAAAVDDAARQTDDHLAGRVSSLIRLTDDEIKALFPNKGDVQKLAELMSIVRGAAGHQQKVNQLAANAERLGSVIVTLLGKFA